MDEFTIRSAASSSSKTYTVFKLHKDDNVSWTEARMRRENEFQPWQIKFGSGRTGRRFKAIKEGGVGDNASYFIFYKPNPKCDTYEVCPVDEWYNVSATQRYKTLTAEEAEQRFEQRHKTLNLFSIMHLKNNGESTEEGMSGQGSRGFKVSEMDDWDKSGDDDNFSGNEDEDDADKKKKKKTTKKEKEEEDAPEEAKEESDEGDFEQREVDYMSDSSSSSSASEQDRDETEVKGIAEEDALRDLLSTDDEEDEEDPQQKGKKSVDSKANINVNNAAQENDANGSDDSSDSDDYDVDEEKMDSMFMKNNLPAQLTMVKQEVQEPEPSNSRQSSVASKKRLAPEVSVPPPQPSKRPCPAEVPQSTANGLEKVVEDLIRKYLSRKPMTLKTLLKDIKSKLKRMDGAKTSNEMDIDLIASIIKRLQPDMKKINDVFYLSLK